MESKIFLERIPEEEILFLTLTMRHRSIYQFLYFLTYCNECLECVVLLDFHRARKKYSWIYCLSVWHSNCLILKWVDFSWWFVLVVLMTANFRSLTRKQRCSECTGGGGGYKRNQSEGGYKISTFNKKSLTGWSVKKLDDLHNQYATEDN
jgi:hypothetical protein